MTQNREGETGNIPFRSGRLFSVGMQWYFMTREGLDRGPYMDKTDTEAELMLFIREQRMLDERLTSD